jgi:peptide chain release factor 1
MFLERLKILNSEFEEISRKLSDSSTILSKSEYIKLTDKYFSLRTLIEKYSQYSKLLSDLKDVEMLKKSKDDGIRGMAYAEHSDLTKKQVELECELKILLTPHDPEEKKNIIMEIRAGTGGDEAALFVGSLYKMYVRFVERNSWKYEVLDSNSTEFGGYKEVIFEIRGNKVWRYFKFERGVHRVQRVPETEASGRVHTSTVTVAVLPEAEEVDVKIKAEDIRIDTYRASGAGGQHVNKTDSAIRITHLPTGFVVSCQDERSQIKNKTKAFKILMAKLYERKLLDHEEKLSNKRKQQIGSGDRSEKIRTYNFQQSRVTDHRIGYSMYNITEIMDGDLMGLFNKLIEASIESTLKK